jgi:hypothetical protein
MFEQTVVDKCTVSFMPDGMIRFCGSVFLCRDRLQQAKRQMNDIALNILTQVLSYTFPGEENDDC